MAQGQLGPPAPGPQRTQDGSWRRSGRRTQSCQPGPASAQHPTPRPAPSSPGGSLHRAPSPWPRPTGGCWGGGLCQEEALGGGGRLEPHRGASCSTAQCRPCPCAARSPGRRGPPSGCSNSAGPAAPRAPGRSAGGSASGRSRALRGEGALSARWGSACGPPEPSTALAPGRQPPAPWAEETPSPQPGPFSLEEQRPAQLPLPLGPDGKLLGPEDAMPSHLTSRLPSVLGTAAASGRLPSTAGEHRSGHDYRRGALPALPITRTLSWGRALCPYPGPHEAGGSQTAGRPGTVSLGNLGGPTPAKNLRAGLRAS